MMAALACMAAAPVSAETANYESLLDGAILQSPANVAAAYWHRFARCDKRASEREQLQCEAIARSAAGSASRRFIVESRDALHAGEFDAKKKSIILAVHGCVACARPIAVDGGSFMVSGGPVRKVKSAKVVARGTVIGPLLGTLTIPVADGEAAKAWKETVWPRLVAELVVETRPEKPLWRVGKRTGAEVKIVGWRVYDPCTGELITSSPPALDDKPDPKRCN